MDDDTALRMGRGRSQFIQQEATTERKRAEVEQGMIDMAGLIEQPAETGVQPGQTAGGGPRRGGPRGLRNNNPGNLRATDIPWQGKVGNDGSFEQFATPEDGLRAAAKNLVAGASKGANTIRTAIARWAPPSENDTDAYIQRVSSALGVDPDAPIDLSDPKVNAAVLGEIVGHENGQQPFSQEQLLSASNAALGVGNTPNVAQGGGSGVVTPAQPRSLRDIQLAKDARPEPSPLTTAVRAGLASENEARGKQFVAALDPNNNDPQAADIRRNGAKYAPDYANVRSTLPQAQRDALDQHVMTATAERLQQISAELYQGATGGKANRLVFEKEQLTKAVERVKKERTADTIDRMLPRSTPPGDKAAAAGQAAVDTAVKGGPVKATPSEVKAGEATVNQWANGGPKKRLSPDQIKRAARLVAIGVMSNEQFTSFVQYGTFEKPEKPTFINIGNGLVGVYDERNGYRVIDHSKPYAAAEAAGKKGTVGANGLTAPEVRARAEQNWTNGFKYLESAASKLDDGMSPAEHMGRFMQFVTRFAPQIEARKGFQLTDPYTGETTLGLVDAGQFNDLVTGYMAYANEELDAWFPDGKEYPDYLSAPDAKGWAIRPAGK